MALRIYLEAKEVINFIGTGHGHLYLVLRDDALPMDQENARVIRGGPGAAGLEIQSDILLSVSEDRYFDENGTPHGTPFADRFSIDITDRVGGVNQWGNLANVATDIAGLYPYEIPNTGESIGNGSHISNSNATILTVLNLIGVDVRGLVNQFPAPREFGDSHNYAGATSFWGNTYGTLLGSGDNPWIVASAAMDDQGLTLYGRRDFDDKMIGTDQDDYFFGNSGNDEVFWGKGNDVYLGGHGKDTYNLEQSINPVNLTIGYSAGHEAFGLTLAAHIEANIIAGEYSTYTHEVERFALSGGDDTVSFVGDLNAYSEVSNLSDVEIQAGPQGENGDTLDLQGITSSGDISISLTDTAGTITQGNTTIGNLLNFENVVGSNSNDTITGSDASNILYGGDGGVNRKSW